MFYTVCAKFCSILSQYFLKYKVSVLKQRFTGQDKLNYSQSSLDNKIFE